MTEIKNIKIPSGYSAFGWWSFNHDGGSICDIHNDDCGFDKSLDSCPVAESYIKSKLVAILTEIQLEIAEKSYYDTTIIGNYEDEVRIDLVELDDVNDIIQQKITELKEKK